MRQSTPAAHTSRNELKADVSLKHRETWLPSLLCAKPYSLVKRTSTAAYFLLGILLLTRLPNMNSGKILPLIIWTTTGPHTEAFPYFCMWLMVLSSVCSH